MHQKMNSETRTFLLLETMYKFREQVSNPQLATFVALAQLNVQLRKTGTPKNH